MNWVLKDEEDCDTRSRRGEGCFKQMKQHEQRQTDTALGGGNKWFSTASEMYGDG